MPGVDVGTRWERSKRQELDRTRSQLADARAHLNALVARGRVDGLEDDEMEDLAPASYEIARLRLASARLADELDAITAEWS